MAHQAQDAAETVSNEILPEIEKTDVKVAAETGENYLEGVDYSSLIVDALNSKRLKFGSDEFYELVKQREAKITATGMGRE